MNKNRAEGALRQMGAVLFVATTNSCLPVTPESVALPRTTAALLATRSTKVQGAER